MSASSDGTFTHGPVAPFESSERPADPGLALVLRTVRSNLHRLLRADPWVPIPQVSCCYHFGAEKRPLPLGAAALLWERWPAASGTCTACAGQIVAVGFGGLLSRGGVVACCVGCANPWFRQVGGFVRARDEVVPHLRDTPYALSTGVFGGPVSGPKRPIVELLRAHGLAAPSDAWVAAPFGKVIQPYTTASGEVLRFAVRDQLRKDDA